MSEGKAQDVSLVTREIHVGDRTVYVTEERRGGQHGQSERNGIG